jgi:phage/plasmid primase-like uncharacterized protein
LTLPVTDFTGGLSSLQFIAADGGKLLLCGGRKRSCFIHVAGDKTIEESAIAGVRRSGNGAGEPTNRVLNADAR